MPKLTNPVLQGHFWPPDKFKIDSFKKLINSNPSCLTLINLSLGRSRCEFM